MTAAVVVAGLVFVGFVVLAAEDLRSQRIAVRRAQAVTALALVGLALVALATSNWLGLVTALIGAALVTGIQAVPYLAQRRRSEPGIGRADVRLGVPFGWTLGYFGLGFAVVGFAAALLSGLGAVLVTGNRRIPFIPFLTVGLLVGLVWAVVVGPA